MPFSRTQNYLKSSLFLFLLFILTLATVFADAAVATFEAWQKEEYSHGYLIPLVSLILLFNRMNDERPSASSSWVGFWLMAACILAQLVFVLAGIRGLQPQALIVFIIAFFVLLYGMRSAYTMAGPLLFLIFAAPLPKFLYYTLSFNMQMMSSSLGTALLQLLGISVYQEGNIIDLGGYQLQIIEACNGLRYLFPLMALGFMLAYMYKTSMLKRAILFVSTVPITIVMNSLRIAIIGITVDMWGKKMAEGLIHDMEGWIVFLGCAFILLVEIKIMQKIGSSGKFDFDCLRLPSLKALPAPAFGKPGKAAVVILAVASVIGGASHALFSGRIQPVPLQKPFTEFPMQIGEWSGRMGSLDERALAVLGTKDYMIADYVNPEGEVVNLYVLYYPQQDSTSNQGLHSPAVCVPAGGWEIDSKDLKHVQLPEANELTVNRMIISKNGTRQLVYYWFVQGNTRLWSLDLLKFVQARNAIFTGRTEGSMIRVTTPIEDSGTIEQAEIRLNSFVQDNIKTISSYLGCANEF